MGWTVTPSSGYKWAVKTNLEQFWKALQERQKLVNQSPSPLPATGCKVQSKPNYDSFGMPTDAADPHYIGHLQKWILDNLTLFVDTTKTFDGSGDKNIVWNWTKATFFGCVLGAGVGDFTRKYPYRIPNNTATQCGSGTAIDPYITPAEGDKARCNADDKTYQLTSGVWVECANPYGTKPTVKTTTGLMQQGDYIGWWIWAELKAAFNELRWRAFDGAWQSYLYNTATPPELVDSHVGISLAEGVEATARQEALDDWDLGYLFKDEYSSGLPREYWWNTRVIDGYEYAEDGITIIHIYYLYEKDIFTCQKRLRQENLNTDFSKAVELFVYCEPPKANSWDVQNQDPATISENQWKKFETQNLGAAADVVTATIVHGDIGTLPPNENGADGAAGWEVTKQKALIKFDVAGGLIFK